MKISICFLSALAGMMALHVASSSSIGAAAADEDSELGRVVGGRNAAAGQFPYAAALFRNGRFICTSSIIGETTVLTAAHCVVSNGETGAANEFHAIANVRKSSRTLRIDFASITPHPEYDINGIKNDIAVFKTTEPIPFSDTVQPVCIAANDSYPEDNEEATAMGWGDYTRLRIFSPDNLNYVRQKIVNSRTCRLAYFGGQVEDYKICAGDLLTGICNGDSGGPLVYQDEEVTNNEIVQIGVASYGSAIAPCGTVTPAVWTRVSSFNSFIKEVAAGDELCEVE